MDERAKPAVAADPVDRFVADILRHPERAGDLAHSFRRELASARPAAAMADAVAADASDEEDLWDNLPV